MNYTGKFPSSPFKRHFEVTLGKMLQPAATKSEDQPHPYLRAANIEWGSVNSGDLKEMYFSKSDLSKYTVDAGDLVVLEGGDVGRASIVPQELAGTGFQNSVHRVRAKNGNDLRFALFWLQHLKSTGYFELVCSKATLAHFTSEKFAVSPFPRIDLPTQKRIATFLDRETARIDELIAKKERLLSALDAKLRAAITRAVTQGANSDAEMKDSGIDWIGQVPTQWSITKLGYLGRCANGINIGGDAFGAGFPFISYGDVYKNRVLPNSGSGLVQSSVSDRASYTVKAGDVFFTRTSETIEEVGFSSVCMEAIENAVFAGFLIRFRPSKGKLHPLFSKFAFQHSGLRDYFAKEMNLITRASLSQDLLRNMPVALPPMHEQEVIGHNLEKLETTTRTITDKTQETIERLKERRAALITAAVTGQIDVETYGKAGTTSETLDRIEGEMQV